VTGKIARRRWGPVYRLLGAEDLSRDTMPELNQPIMHTLAFPIRSGKHEITAFDWLSFRRLSGCT
jgi:hypothetical protein